MVAVLGVAAVLPAPARAALTLTRVAYEGAGPVQGCEAPLPGMDGKGAASFRDPQGAYQQRWEWSVPTTVARGAGASIKVDVETFNSGGASATINIRTPLEFGIDNGSRTQLTASAPTGAPSRAADQQAFTFSPSREFAEGEKHVIRIGIDCAAFLYEYVASAPPPPPPGGCRTNGRGAAFAAQAGEMPKPNCPPRIQPASRPPALGQATAHPIPAPGGTAASAGPRVPATVSELSGEVRFVDGDGRPIEGPSAAAIEARAFDADRLCITLLLERPGVDDRGFESAIAEYRRCRNLVARILARRDQLRQQQGGRPPVRAAQAPRCRTLRPRRFARVRVKVTCTPTVDGLRVRIRTVGRRIKLRRALGHAPIRLIVARSRFAARAEGERMVVRWTGRR